MLEARIDKCASALRRTPQLTTFGRRATAAAVKAMPTALHGVSLVDVEDTKLRGLETRVACAVWGASRTSRAKEIIFCLMTPRHRTSPIVRASYEQARRAREAGTTQVLFQAV